MSNKAKLESSFSRRDFLRLGAAGAASAALGSLGLSEFVSAKGKARKPNIVVILADDLGYGELGCYGFKDIPTPNIDSIASNGVRFTSGYVSCPICSPTRAGLMTGRYQQRYGHEHNITSEENINGPCGLPLSEITLAERLKPEGYKTGLIGKWHLGFKPDYTPTKRGFDEFFGFLAAAHSYEKSLINTWNPIYKGTEQYDEREYLTDAFSREATSFISRHAKEPFFLYLALSAVHTPIQATDKYLKRFASVTPEKRKTFSAMLSAMDDAVGNVLAELRKNNLEEDTLVIFLGDNGGDTPQSTCRNTPLRGIKHEVWEGGIRIPYMMQWKNHLPVGKVYEKPITALDILPTALAAVGVKSPSKNKLDGINLLPYLHGEKSDIPHKDLYWRLGKDRAIRSGDFKLVWMDGNDPELYDLASDIGEANNLATQKPDKVKELEELYNKWNALMVPPRWGGGIPKTKEPAE